MCNDVSNLMGYYTISEDKTYHLLSIHYFTNVRKRLSLLIDFQPDKCLNYLIEAIPMLILKLQDKEKI